MSGSSEGSIARPVDRHRPIARRAQHEPLPRHRANHPEPAHHRMADRPRRRDQAHARPIGMAAERLDDDRAAAVGAPVRGRSRERAPGIRLAAGDGDDVDVAAGELHVDDRAIAGGGFEQRRGGLASEQLRQRRRIDDSPHDGIVGVRGGDDVLAGADLGQERLRGPCVVEVAFRAELLEDAERLVQVPFGDRARAGLGHQTPEREMTERRLIALAEQIEQRRALREIVIGVGGAVGPGVQRTAQAEIFAPRGRRDSRVEGIGGRRQPRFRLGEPVGEGQRLGGDERRLERVERRRAGLKNFVHACDRVVEVAAPQREPRAEHAHRPLVPLAGLAAVGAVRLAGAAEKIAGRVVAAADEMNLRERVEDGAGRFVELNRAAHFERAVQRVLGADEIAQAHADLAERGERHREAVAGPVRFVQRHAPLRQRERLLVTMLKHHHVGLVAADGREDVVGLHHRGEALRLPQRRHRLVVAPELRERDAGERVDEREMTAIAGGVQGGGRLGNVLADDRDVADLPVALPELVVREADAAGVVRRFRVLQRARVHGDRARLIAARRREPSVQAPERGDAPGRHGVAEGVRGAAERAGGLVEIVLQERRLGLHRADGQLFVPRERRAQRGREHLRGFRATAAFERGAGANQKRLEGRRRHGEYLPTVPRDGTDGPWLRGALRGARNSRSRRTPTAPCR